MIVAIDGPAGSGKSTIARVVAEQTNFIYLNSGKIYRAVTYAAITRGISNSLDEVSIANLLSTLQISLTPQGTQLNDVLLDKELHTDSVDSRVAEVSSFPKVRDFVNRILRKESEGRDVVVEGRDMTTVVFPEAEVKWFIDASVEARARRRYNQGTSQLSYSDNYAAIQNRDKIDREKKFGALTLAADAGYLDTSDLTIEAVCAKVIESIQGHKSPQE